MHGVFLPSIYSGIYLNSSKRRRKGGWPWEEEGWQWRIIAKEGGVTGAETGRIATNN